MMINTNNIFVGMLLSDQRFMEAVDLGWESFSQQKTQKAIFEGIRKNYDDNITNISIINVPHFNKYKKLIIDSYYESNQSIDSYNVGFINLKYINHLIKIKNAKKFAKKYIDKELDNIFIYSMHRPLLVMNKQIKRDFPNSNTILFIPDLPQFMDPNQGLLKRILKSIDIREMYKLIQYVDYFIVFSDQMIEFLRLPKEKCFVMEGIYSRNIDIESEFSKNDVFTLMYSGTLNEQYNIDKLLELGNLFAKNEIKIEIWFAGSGKLTKRIEEESIKNNVIKYFGVIKDSKELIKYQKKANLLVNLRTENEMSGKYAFPSKIIDYMATGTPVITTNFSNLREEYKEHLYIIDELNIENLYYQVLKISKFNQSDLNKKGAKAKRFILENKTSASLIEKIKKFVNGV